VRARRKARVAARERAVQALCELAEEGGMASVEMAAVRERAGLGEEEFGRLFEGREELEVACTRMLIGEVMLAVSTNYTADRSEWDSALHAIKAILEAMSERPAHAQIAYIGLREACEQAREERESMVRILVVMLERLGSYSEVEVQSARAARAAIGGAEALLRREIVAGRGAELPRVLPDCVYVATVPFLGQEEALRLARRGRALLRDGAWG
jgi:hypothetical protein